MSVIHSPREVVEGMQYQGSTETITYSIDVTNWGTSPSSPTLVVLDANTGADVTSTVCPSGSLSVNGNVVTLKPITALTPSTTYCAELTFTCGGSVYQAFLYIVCDR
jgi:hypothetical protein